MKIIDKFKIENQKKRWMINAAKRKSNFIKKNLYVNDQITNLRVGWLRSQDDIDNYLAPKNEFDYNVCYLINSIITFNNLNFNNTFDFVIVNLWWEVTNLFPNCKPGKLNIKLDHVSHVIILPENGINQLNVKINSIVRPMLKIN